MKLSVIASATMNNAKILQINVEGISNIHEMHVLTQREDMSYFSSNEFMDDMGIIRGTDYISNEYFYGSQDQISSVQSTLMQTVSNLPDLCEEDYELMEVYFIVFNDNNGKQMLVSNAVETLSYLDVELPDTTGVKSIVCGSIADDNDISTIMTEALFVHPKTKGFKVPGSDFFEYHEEAPSYSNFEEYMGTFFSCTKSLKKDPEWFEFFEAIQRLVTLNPELEIDVDPDGVDDNEFILNQEKSCQTIPDMVQLIFKSEESHKFYNVEINHHAVIIEYGGVGKASTVDEKEFDTREDAKKFMDKKVISKIKSGYVKQ